MSENRRVILILYIFSCILAATILLKSFYRNNYHSDGQWIFNEVRQAVRVQIGKAQSYNSPDLKYRLEARDIKLSLPINSTPNGCETIYAVAETFDNKGLAVSRYLLRFKYAAAKYSCVAEDLSLPSLSFPAQIIFSIVEIESTSAELIEKPREIALSLSYNDKKDQFLITEKNYKPALLADKIYKNQSFSWDDEANQTEMLSAPYQNFKERLLNEINNSIKACKENSDCAPIRAAVARISDPDIIKSLKLAQDSGIAVELITNSADNFPDNQTYNWQGLSPALILLEGNLLSRNTKARLPMHAKFIIFGNRLVISGNSSYAFDKYPASKEFNFAYRSKKAVEVFSELYNITRSGFFYPLKVDTTKDISLLANVDRPRGYSRSKQKPHLEISTEENISSTAYGIIFDYLDRNANQLKLAMSPLTNSCAFYRGRLCLKDVLQNIQNKQGLSLILNAFFFLSTEAKNWMADDSSDIFWERTPIDSAESQFGEFSTFLRHFGLSQQGMAVKVAIDRFWSSHHERIGVINRDVVIAGSANFAVPGTLNTIELIKNKQFACKVLDDLQMSTEPYFIAAKNNLSPSYRSFGECEFVFEQNLLETDKIHKFKIPWSDVKAEFIRKYGQQHQPISTIVPENIDQIFTSEENLRSIKFRKESINQFIESRSHYLCVGDEQGLYRVVKISDKSCNAS